MEITKRGALACFVVIASAINAPGALAAATDPVTTTTTTATPPPATTTTTTVPPAPTGPTVATGVKVGTTDLSGLTQDAAKTAIAAAYKTSSPNNKPLVVKIATRPHKLSMTTIGYGVNATATAALAIKADANKTITPVPTWNTAKVNSWVTSLSKIQKKARDAKVTLGFTKQRITKPRSGWSVSKAALAKLVDKALKDPTLDRALTQPVIRVKPKLTITQLRKKWPALITVDRATYKLRLFKNLRLKKTYKVAVGRAGLETPRGTYYVTSKDPKPAWHVPNSAWAGDLAGKTIPYGDPRNPIKARWIGLADGIGIHGTAEAASLGSRASHGCIRMAPADVIKLYDATPMGTMVKIR